MRPKNSIVLVVLLLSVILINCHKKPSQFVQKQIFNTEWQFVRLSESDSLVDHSGSNVNTSDWETVQLPHSAKLEPVLVNDQWQGICWYRKSFEINPELKDKKLFLHFEGAMNKAEVWINGTKKITHQGGYLPFVIDFTNEANLKGTNTVAVRLDNKDNSITGPKPMKVLDFNMYSGIYRNVWLIAKNNLRITDPISENKIASGGIFVSYPEVTAYQASVRVQTHLINENLSNKEFSILNNLLLGEEIVSTFLAEGLSLEAGANAEFLSELKVQNPQLWSPDEPNLYVLETAILQNGEIIDKQTTRIGIKTIEFHGQDFYLNGKKTFLRGVNRHQEYPFVGYALSDNAQYRDAKKIKDAGFDYVRLSHYPHSTAFMDACDELGIVTIDAILGWQYYREDELFKSHIYQTARDMIRRDRNHASVLAWEVSLNESWMPEPFIDSLHTIAHEEYPGDQCFSAGWQSYGFDIYLQARQHRLGHDANYPPKPYVVSEYGDWEYYAMNAGLNQDSWGELLQNDRSSRQLRTENEKRLLQQATNLQEAHNDNFNTPAFADGYWVMYDYNRGYANDLESSGIMDIFRLPKFSYYFYKSQRKEAAPMVYAATYWNSDSPLNVRVFSNCDEVELLLNEKSLGINKPAINTTSENLVCPPFEFKIANFEAGQIKAIGYINGRKAAEHVINTPEEPDHLEIQIDESGRPLKAGCNDVVFVYIRLLDKNNTTVLQTGGELSISLSGDSKIINTQAITFEAGIATAVIQLGNTPGDINIKANYQNYSMEKTATIQ